MSTEVRVRSFAYQPGLDGLRALAVLGVMAYHADLRWMRGGYLGVDAFFVLSGFLITGLLLAEHREDGRISLGAFWARRARRLLPALLLVLAAVTAIAAINPEIFDPRTTRNDALAVLAYVANWRFVFSGAGYFEQFAAPSPLLHAWSLSIEEQFYLLWPPTVAGLAALRSARREALPLALPLVLGAASAVLMALLTGPGVDVSRAYYGTDARAQSLLVGAGLAVLLQRHPRPVAGRARLALEGGAIVAIAGLGWAWSTVDGTSPRLYRGGFLVLAVAVAVVIASATQPSGVVRRALSMRPLQAVGRISYGLYLWHWPVFLVLTPTRAGWDDPALLASRFAATFALAYLSYELVERPVRRGTWGALRGRRGWVAAPAALAVVAGAAWTTAAVAPEPRGAFALRLDRVPTIEARLDEATTMTAPAGSAPEGSRAPVEERVRVLVTGDSVALTLAFGVAAGGEPYGISVLNGGGLGCPLVREFDAWEVGGRVDPETPRAECDWSQSWRRVLEEFDPHVSVVMFGPWDAHDRRVGGTWFRVGTDEWRRQVARYTQEAIDILTSRGGRVVLATSPYYRRAAEPGQADDEANEDWRIDALNGVYRDVAARDPRVTLYDLNATLSPGGRYARSIDGMVVRPDGVHIHGDGGILVMESLGPILAQEGEAVARARATG